MGGADFLLDKPFADLCIEEIDAIAGVKSLEQF
jgi:hypothetical protein